MSRRRQEDRHAGPPSFAAGPEQPLCQFEARRSGDSGTSRMFGGYRGDKAILKDDFEDRAQDLAEFTVRTRPKTR